MKNTIHAQIQAQLENNIHEDNIDISFLVDMPEDTLSDFIQQCDIAYEKCEPFVSDYLYDKVFSYFSEKYPDSDLVTNVRPDHMEDENLEKVKHSAPMLSTEKAYTKKEIDSWLNF